jgi:hypothetical protein
MKNTPRFVRASLFLVASLALATGCGGGKPPPKNVPVSGIVTLDKEPLTSGQVSLLPISEKQSAASLSAGTIDSSGKFTIFTGGKEGAPVGTYKVTVSPPMMPPQGGGPPLQLPAKYQDASQTVLKMEVVENPAPGAYDLKLTK